MEHARHIVGPSHWVGPKCKLLLLSFFPIWDGLAHEHSLNGGKILISVDVSMAQTNQQTYCNDYERLNFPALVPIVFPAETRKHNSSSLRCEESCPNEGAREEEQAERASGAARSRRSPCTLTHPQPQTGGRRGGHSQAQLAAAQKQASKRRKQKEGRNREGRKEAHNAAVDDYRRKLASDGQVRRRRRRCLRVRAQNWRFPTKCSTK